MDLNLYLSKTLYKIIVLNSYLYKFLWQWTHMTLLPTIYFFQLNLDLFPVQEVVWDVVGGRCLYLYLFLFYFFLFFADLFVLFFFSWFLCSILYTFAVLKILAHFAIDSR